MLSMSSTVLDPSYLPLEMAATPCMPQTEEASRPEAMLALVIPTLREAANLLELLTRLRKVLDGLHLPCEILVVDDDSGDGTAGIVHALARKDERVRLLVRKGERGLSGAILDGWLRTGATMLGVMDADLQHPPELVPELVAAILRGNDLAIGSRYATGGGLGPWNPVRRLLSTAALRVTRPLQMKGIRVKDPLSGFFLVRRECLGAASYQRSGFKLLLEILVRGRVRSVAEIPFAFGQRRAGASKFSFKVAFEFVRLLARLCLGRLASRFQGQAAADFPREWRGTGS